MEHYAHEEHKHKEILKKAMNQCGVWRDHIMEEADSIVKEAFVELSEQQELEEPDKVFQQPQYMCPYGCGYQLKSIYSANAKLHDGRLGETPRCPKLFGIPRSNGLELNANFFSWKREIVQSKLSEQKKIEQLATMSEEQIHNFYTSLPIEDYDK